MGLMDYLKGQFLEIIEWTDDSRDTLSWRFPDDDKEIKNGAQLIIGVEMSREALIGLLPPDQQEAGEFAIVGPMYLVSTFEKP